MTTVDGRVPGTDAKIVVAAARKVVFTSTILGVEELLTQTKVVVVGQSRVGAKKAVGLKTGKNESEKKKKIVESEGRIVTKKRTNQPTNQRKG